MNFIVYLFVALIAAGSVLFGLGYVPAPMSPMPPSKYEIRAAVLPPSPAPVVAEVKPDLKPEAKAEAKPDVKPAAAPATALAARPTVAPRPAAPAAAIQPPASLNPADQPPASIVAAEPGSASPDTAVAGAPKCNVEVCASAYRSFTAADCTYQPSDGPRRLCTKGAPPPAIAAPATPVAPSTTAAGTAAPEARAQACNVAACSQSYPRSFSAADCTFQPSDGPRRTCTK